jgi:superfamily II DNA/RNA helicase
MQLIKIIKSLFTKNKKHLEFVKPSEEKKESSANAFAELGLAPALIEKLTQNNFTIPTEVQKKAIPIALKGKNIFCSSETGSGKTLAFLLPMINKFYCNEISQALILCPTREIALQTQKILKGFDDKNLTSALVIGGTNMELQKEALRKYPEILVATPGRLLDMLDTGYIWLNYTGYVVLDEADRMLDMGFEEDLIKIHAHFSDNLQMVLFSATLFPEIKKMAKRYADNYEEIIVGNPASVASSVEHIVVKMKPDEKFAALKYLIRGNPGKTIVFFNTINETTKVAQKLNRQGFPNVDYIHSKVDQPGREAIINDFREEKIEVLLASDVAARGIDIPNVEMVVNYDIPNNSEDYIHRVGRTGRAGKQGTAISFYSEHEKNKLDAIEKLIKVKIERRNK